MTALKPFLTSAVGATVSLQSLILANMSYLYGTAYRDSLRYSTMKVLYVDYDGAPNSQLSTNTPRRNTQRSKTFTKPSAKASTGEPAKAYDNTQALGYVYNSAKYPAYAQGVYSNLVQFSQAAAGVYTQTNLITALSAVNGVRFYYNTVSMVMPIIIQFFFTMALGGISGQTNIFNTFFPRQKTILRFTISVCYTFIAALVMTGYIWAFRENWDVSSGQFALTWMAIWLAMHVHFLSIDFGTSVIPMSFLPFFILTWIILNVSSTIGPFELSPGFYHIGYIWTDGCNQHKYRALSILWCEWIVALVLVVVGMGIRTKSGFKTFPNKESSEV
ncbi:hypothetical protein BDV10DRAFT_195685 [Aspergillus recurvatus]